MFLFAVSVFHRLHLLRIASPRRDIAADNTWRAVVITEGTNPYNVPLTSLLVVKDIWSEFASKANGNSLEVDGWLGKKEMIIVCDPEMLTLRVWCEKCIFLKKAGFQKENKLVSFLDYTVEKFQPVHTAGFNDVVLAILLIVVKAVKPAIRCNNAEQYCWQHWTMWAAKHWTILFSSTLQQNVVHFCCARVTHLKTSCWTNSNPYRTINNTTATAVTSDLMVYHFAAKIED